MPRYTSIAHWLVYINAIAVGAVLSLGLGTKFVVAVAHNEYYLTYAYALFASLLMLVSALFGVGFSFMQLIQSRQKALSREHCTTKST